MAAVRPYRRNHRPEPVPGGRSGSENWVAVASEAEWLLTRPYRCIHRAQAGPSPRAERTQ